MQWTARINDCDHIVSLQDTAVELLHWAYNPELPDNVPHRHTYFEVCLVGEYGSGIFTVEATPHPVGPGDLFIARPGVVHQIQNTGARPMELYWVAFSWPAPTPAHPDGPGLMANLMRDFASSKLLVTPDNGSLTALWRALAALASATEYEGRDWQLQAVSGALLLAIAQAGCAPQATLRASATRTGTQPAGQDLARLAIRYIHDNLHRGLEVEEVARHVYLSPRHLSRVVQAFTGVNPSTYILRARMDRARNLLEHSDLNIKTIARNTGYRDAQHFSRVFKSHFGLAPTTLRRQGHPRAAIQTSGDLV